MSCTVNTYVYICVLLYVSTCTCTSVAPPCIYMVLFLCLSPSPTYPQVSPQFTGLTTCTSHSSLHTTSSATTSHSRPSAPPSHAPRARKQVKCAAKTKPREIKVLFPPRTRPTRPRGRQMDATQRERHRAGESGYHRTPLVEIDDNSIEMPSHFDRRTNWTTMNDGTQMQTQVGTFAVGGVACQENGRAMRDCDQEECRPKLQAQSTCHRHSIPPENVQPVMSCTKVEVERSWRRGSQVSPGPTDMQDLSALMESTCISTSPRTPQPEKARVETLLAGDHEGWCNPAQNQSNLFDVTTFHPPSSSTPLGCKRTQCLDREEGDGKRNENSGTMGRHSRKRCTRVSPTRLPVELSSAGRTLDSKATRGCMMCVQKNELVEHNSTVLAQVGSSSNSTFINVHTPVLRMDETGLSNASILAPETPPEHWDTCRHFGTRLRRHRVGSHSRDMVSIQDSFV